MKKAVTTLSIIILLIFLMMSGNYNFFETSICTECGLVKHSQQKQIPYLANISYWTVSEIKHTPLSKILYHHNRIDNHAHIWRLCNGYGSYIFKDGDGLSIKARAESNDVCNFIEFIIKYNDSVAQKWVKIFLHPETPFYFSQFMPKIKFQNKEEFVDWWNKNFLIVIELSLSATAKTPQA